MRGGSESIRAPVVHGDRAATERLRRDQLEPSRAGQPALVQGRAVAGDPGVDEELVLVDQILPVQFGRELAATEEHAGRGRVLELQHACAQVAGDVVAVGPRKVLSRRRHHVLRLGLQLDRPLAQRRRRLLVAAGDRRPVALHHLVGDAAPQHRPALVHEAGEEGVYLVVGDSLLVVDAAVQGDVDAEGQESHAASLMDETTADSSCSLVDRSRTRRRCMERSPDGADRVYEARLSEAIPEELWTSKAAELQEELRRVGTEMERQEMAGEAPRGAHATPDAPSSTRWVYA